MNGEQAIDLFGIECLMAVDQARLVFHPPASYKLPFVSDLEALVLAAVPRASLTDAKSQIHERQSQLAYSPPFYPSPWMDPTADGWADAYAQAKALVSQMTILEKVNLTTGVG